MRPTRAPICILPVRPSLLAPAIGAVGAAALARALVDDAVTVVRTLPWARPVRATDDDIARVLSQACREHDNGAAFAIGAAASGVPAARHEAARAALRRAEAVLGPADGGGLYLIGLRQCPRGLLAGVPWGTRHAFDCAYERLRSRGLAPVVLDRWFTVDGPHVIDRLRALVRAGVLEGPATARLLAPRITAIVTVGEDGAGAAETLASIDRIVGVDDAMVVGAHPEEINAAARRAHADVLWLVRAGTIVPPDADRHIVDALLDGEVVAGAFGTYRIAADARGGWRARLQPAARLADLRSTLLGLPHAGQALFVRRSTFERVGGVPAELLGDLELARRLRRCGRVVRVPARVIVRGQVARAPDFQLPFQPRTAVAS